MGSCAGIGRFIDKRVCKSKICQHERDRLQQYAASNESAQSSLSNDEATCFSKYLSFCGEVQRCGRLRETLISFEESASLSVGTNVSST